MSYVSESGALELFVFSSTATGHAVYSNLNTFNRNKKVQRDLAIISGFIPLPPIFSLGFHFSKWANVDADMIMDRNKNFSQFGFPVDVLWADIDWAFQNSTQPGPEYFIFNPQNFTATQIAKMNNQIEASQRRIVVIADPHIKKSPDYKIYSNGIKLQDAKQPKGNLTNIFVRDY